MDRDISTRSYTRKKKLKGNERRVEKDKIKFHKKQRKKETEGMKRKKRRESIP